MPATAASARGIRGDDVDMMAGFPSDSRDNGLDAALPRGPRPATISAGALAGERRSTRFFRAALAPKRSNDAAKSRCPMVATFQAHGPHRRKDKSPRADPACRGAAL